MISSPGWVCQGAVTPGAMSMRAWRASRPGTLRSWRCRSVRVTPGTEPCIGCIAIAFPAITAAAVAARIDIRRSIIDLQSSKFKDAGGWGRSPPASLRSADRLERRPQLPSENHRLLPGGKVTALFGVMVVDEVGVGLLGPAPRRLILLARENADRHRDLDALRVEEAALIFPVKPRRGHAGIGQPVE